MFTELQLCDYISRNREDISPGPAYSFEGNTQDVTTKTNHASYKVNKHFEASTYSGQK